MKFQETQKRVRLAIQGTLEDDAIESGAQPSKPAAKPAGKAKGAGKPAWAYTEESKVRSTLLARRHIPTGISIGC